MVGAGIRRDFFGRLALSASSQGSVPRPLRERAFSARQRTHLDGWRTRRRSDDRHGPRGHGACLDGNRRRIEASPLVVLALRTGMSGRMRGRSGVPTA